MDCSNGQGTGTDLLCVANGYNVFRVLFVRLEGFCSLSAISGIWGLVMSDYCGNWGFCTFVTWLLLLSS
jgi:hypothetical protein